MQGGSYRRYLVAADKKVSGKRWKRTGGRARVKKLNRKQTGANWYEVVSRQIILIPGRTETSKMSTKVQHEKELVETMSFPDWLLAIIKDPRYDAEIAALAAEALAADIRFNYWFLNYAKKNLDDNNFMAVMNEYDNISKHTMTNFALCFANQVANSKQAGIYVSNAIVRLQNLISSYRQI